jgi:phage gp46-like protein
MPDIRLVQNTAFPNYSVTVDWNLLSWGALDERQALATAIIVALGTDSLADTTDKLPDPNSTDRAGWWGDLDAEEIWDGWPIGCKLWLMKRASILPAQADEGSTLTRIQYYIMAAIQPFVDRRIASTFNVQVSRTGVNSVNALVRIYRGPELEIDLEFQILWDEYPISSIADDGYNIGRLVPAW